MMETAVTPQQLHNLYLERVERTIDVDAVAGRPEELDEAAQEIEDSVAMGRSSSNAYGSALSDATQQLQPGRTLEELLRAMSSLAAETRVVSERNRALEERLTASTARVRKLRSDLMEARQDADTDGLTGLRNRRRSTPSCAGPSGRRRRTGFRFASIVLSNADLQAGLTVAGQIRAVLGGKRLVTRAPASVRRW